jgi:Bax protein
MKIIVAFLISMVCVQAQNVQRIYVSNYKEIETVYNQYQLSPSDWKKSSVAVPRLYIANIPTTWKQVSANMTVQEKKYLFLASLLPLILHANEVILEERKIIEHALVKVKHQEDLSDSLKMEVDVVVKHYRHEVQEKYTVAFLEVVLEHVDIIPPSLALAQGASESAWGTSRFTSVANSLFGQWTWSGGVTPEKQRKALGNYGIQPFETSFECVAAYMHNINTTKAYDALRKIRSKARREGRAISGNELANGLIHYSERGQAYINDLHNLIRINNLAETDDNYLAQMDAIILVPEF